jgi:hypothetical protein
MEISPSTYAGAYNAEAQIEKQGSGDIGFDTTREAATNTTKSQPDNSVTGLTSSRIADDAIGAVIQQSQEVGVEATRELTQFEKLNFVSESDRKLLSAMTGLNVDHIGRFTDNNGNPAFPEDLTQHTLRTFLMNLHGARKSGSPDAIAGENITEAEFLKLMDRSRAVVASMGEKFNDEYLVKGLEYIRGLG